MIFYFSGTGNSKYVAECLEDELVINIADANKAGNYEYSVNEDGKVGFVFPVYYSGLPKPVLDFVRNLKLVGEADYIYAVLTHGGGPGGAGTMLEKQLKKKGLSLQACFDVKMPSNYIMFGDLIPDEEIEERLKNAPALIAPVKEAIDKKEHKLPDWSKMDRFLTSCMMFLCDKNMSAKKFYADEGCIGCGKCARNCPAGIIEMVDGKPMWTDNKCVRCMSCLSCEHVQYGKATTTRRRYMFHK